MYTELDEDHARLAQVEIELVDLTIGAAPLRLGGDALDALDQNPPVPAAIEDDDLLLLGGQ